LEWLADANKKRLPKEPRQAGLSSLTIVYSWPVQICGRAEYFPERRLTVMRIALPAGYDTDILIQPNILRAFLSVTNNLLLSGRLCFFVAPMHPFHVFAPVFFVSICKGAGR
jgi:hypothetical protein